MPTLKRAKTIQKHMGHTYNIYWDEKYLCFRVMKDNSISLYQFSLFIRGN